MEHVLDNPVWNALISGNKQLAFGNDQVRYFSPEVSPFVGLRDKNDKQFQMLYDIIPHDGPVGFVSSVEMETPQMWKLIQPNKAFQMVFEQSVDAPVAVADILPLTEEHIPQMLALTKLTNPGPFVGRTIDFGHYYGIFEDDKLVAMAGQRLHIGKYAEISAVCTHPDHLGRGYAKQLLLSHIHRIKAANNVPILHVRTDNHRALSVYQNLGFKARAIIHFNILKKNK